MENLTVYYDEQGSITSVSAVIDGEQHCTGDFRPNNYDSSDCEVVFSKSTKDAMSLQTHETCEKLIELEVYTKKTQEEFDVVDLGEDASTRYRYFNIKQKNL